MKSELTVTVAVPGVNTFKAKIPFAPDEMSLDDLVIEALTLASDAAVLLKKKRFEAA